MRETDAVLAAIAARPPGLDASLVGASVEAQFGLTGAMAPLVSERDQNFRLDARDGSRYVVKIVGRLEPDSAVELQLAALRHLETRSFPGVPRVVRTRAGTMLGRIRDAGTEYRLRVVTFVDGTPLTRIGVDADKARRLGRRLGRLGRALETLVYDGGSPELLWDLQKANRINAVLGQIHDTGARRSVASAIEAFTRDARPSLDALPKQAIHGDPNPDNILFAENGLDVAGLIDFGDMVLAPRVVDVAIAAAYLRGSDDEPLEFVSPMVSAYCAENPLTETETGLLYDLVRARLATTVALLHWRLGSRPPDDPYRRKTLDQESGALGFLDALGGLGRSSFTRQIQQNQ